jgi:hypothetical protein
MSFGVWEMMFCRASPLCLAQHPDNDLILRIIALSPSRLTRYSFESARYLVNELIKSNSSAASRGVWRRRFTRSAQPAFCLLKGNRACCQGSTIQLYVHYTSIPDILCRPLKRWRYPIDWHTRPISCSAIPVSITKEIPYA